jgi:predicted RND superfamily exporter protein
MGWYARHLVRPWVRVLVVVAFTGLFGVSCYSTTLMRQKFKLTDVLPRVSYAADFLDATFTYQNRTLLGAQVVFRDIDQSDAKIRQDMKSYVKSLTDLEFAADSRVETHWTSLFDFYVAFNPEAAGKPFNQQLDEFLSIPFNRAAVGPDIARDEDGNVIASRVYIKFAVDLDDIKGQINLIKKQQEVSLAATLNEGRSERLAAFSYDSLYTVFEFYVRSVQELTSTTILGVISVTVVALIFIPHWTAFIIVCPLTCILYIDLLGVMKWGGLSINSLTFISLTMSIGLIVDYLMHILIRFVVIISFNK